MLKEISEEYSKSHRVKIEQIKTPVWIVCFIFGTVILYRLISFFQINVNWLSYPFWRPGSEGLILDETLRIRHHLPIYGPITQTSFISGPYPPVFYYLSSWLMTLTGETMLAGRLIAFGSALFCAILISYLVWQECRSIWAALLFGPLVLLTSPFLIWASRNRGDILMVAFNLAGLICVNLYWSARNKKEASSPAKIDLFIPFSQKSLHLTSTLFYAGFSIVFFVLAFYTKQTGIAAPLAAAIYLLTLNWRSGLKYIAGLVLSLFVPFIFLEILTRHEFFRHIISYHALPWKWSNFENWIQVFVSDNYVLVVSAILIIITNFGLKLFIQLQKISPIFRSFATSGIQQNKAVPVQNPSISLAVWFGLFSLFGLVSTGVEGADHNHLLLPAAAMCAVVGVTFGNFLRAHSSTSVIGKISPIILCAGLALVLSFQLWFGWDDLIKKYDFDLTSRLSTTEQTQMRKIIEYIRTVDGPILSEEVALPALAGKETLVDYNDVYTMGLLAEAGKWSPEGLAAQVRQKHFALILVPFDLNSERSANHKIWPPTVLQAIKDNYQIMFRDIWFIYVPKS